MEAAYVSAIAALGGSAIGGLTSLAASWVTHHIQFTDRGHAESRSSRASLYWEFIDEASTLYADAYQREEPDLSKLVKLYALLNRMQILSSPPVVAKADRTARAVIATYLSPNKTFEELAGLVEQDADNPLRDFSIACREELRSGYRG